jgi:type II secretory pathway predicted ATPase ExeA
MYLDHFGLAEAPFRITPHTEFFFTGANRGATLDALLYAILNDEGIVKVSGEVGSGKTMLCRVLLERLPAEVVTVYLANPSLSPDDILFAIADELQLALPAGCRTSTLVRALQTKLIELHGDGHQVVVLIDEAHAMPEATLEEIRLLSNLETGRHKLLQLVLFGQPELDEALARQSMRPLRERITQNFHLQPLPRDYIARYLDFRMRTAGYRGPEVFSPAATRCIAEVSQGLTRRINILADKALLAAFADNTHLITPRLVEAAVRDAGYRRPGAVLRKWLPALAAGVALAVAALLVPDGRTDGSAAPAADTNPAAVAVPTAALPAHAWTLEQRLAADREWIAGRDSGRWFVQLVTIGAGEAEFARAYALKAGNLLPAGQIHLYEGGSDADRRIGIIYGDFPSRQAAADAIRHLPQELMNNDPFPRRIRWLK